MNMWKYCPCCGKEDLFCEGHRIQCDCGFDFFDNPAACVGIIFCVEGNIALSKRRDHPGKGLYDFPGGFVNPGENAEDAGVREIKEELHFDVQKSWLKFLTTASNVYTYKGRDVSVVDVYFVVDITKEEFDEMRPQDDVQDIILFDMDSISDELLAFPSVRVAIEALRKK